MRNKPRLVRLQVMPAGDGAAFDAVIRRRRSAARWTNCAVMTSAVCRWSSDPKWGCSTGWWASTCSEWRSLLRSSSRCRRNPTWCRTPRSCSAGSGGGCQDSTVGGGQGTVPGHGRCRAPGVAAVRVGPRPQRRRQPHPARWPAPMLWPPGRGAADGGGRASRPGRASTPPAAYGTPSARRPVRTAPVRRRARSLPATVRRPAPIAERHRPRCRRRGACVVDPIVYSSCYFQRCATVVRYPTHQYPGGHSAAASRRCARVRNPRWAATRTAPGRLPNTFPAAAASRPMTARSITASA